jgi:LacI family transcriptional regulator
MKSATLREIARHAGVHQSTASHVLNGGRGSTRVSPETERRVLETARALGYRADRAAQKLRTRRSHVIGLLVGGLENPFFARMVSLCAEALERAGYETVFAERRRDESADEHLLDTLLSRQLDGLLIWSETATEVRQRLQMADLENCVVIGLPVSGRDSVEAAFDAGVAMALDHLRAQGCERIGYLAPRFAVARFGDPRHTIYRDRMAAWGMRERLYLFDGPAFDMGAARARAEALWTEPAANRPDALLCFNDMTAIGALMGIRHRGGRVPADVALVGCDDLPIAAQMDVPLSSVAFPMEAICAEAVRLLVERIDGRGSAAEEEAMEGRLPPRHVRLPVAFHARASSQRDERSRTSQS